MSELNLTFFMLLGYAQAHWFVVTVFVLGVLVLNYLAWSQKGAFFQQSLLQLTLKSWAGLALFLFLTLPWMTGSGLNHLGYWVDWVLLLVMALGYSFAALFWVYPILRLYQALKPEEKK